MGFHIEDYCVNFLDTCQRILGCRTDKKKMVVEHCGRPVLVRALPIGIPYQRFESLARTAPRVFPTDMKVENIDIMHSKIGLFDISFIFRSSWASTGWTTRRAWWRG